MSRDPPKPSKNIRNQMVCLCFCCISRHQLFSLQELAKTSPDTPQGTQNPPKMATKASKIPPPRCLQDGPKTLPRCAQDCPRPSQDRSKTSQDVARCLQDTPRTSQDRPWGSPRHPQTSPRTPSGTPPAVSQHPNKRGRPVPRRSRSNPAAPFMGQGRAEFFIKNWKNYPGVLLTVG